MAVAGRLNIFINADVKQFTSGLKAVEKAGKRMEGVGRNLTTALSGPIAAAAAAIGVAAVKTAQYAANIDDAAHRTGLSTQAIQELQYVAGQLGTSFEDVEGVLGAFIRRIPQIASGSGDAAKAMRHLGVQVRDASGSIRPMDALFRDTVSALGDVRNETERNALATQVFGRSALEIAPMLAAGGVEIERLTSRAHELGLVMGEDQIANLAAFDDRMQEVRDTAGAAARSLATALLPAVESVLDVVQTSVIPAVQSLGDKLKSVSPNTVRWGIAIAGVAAVAGPAVLVIGSLIRAVAALNLSLLAGGWIGVAAIALGALAAGFLKNKLDAAAATSAIEDQRDTTDEYRRSLEGVIGAEHMLSVARNLERQDAIRTQLAHATSAEQVNALQTEYMYLEARIRGSVQAFNELRAATPTPLFPETGTKAEDNVNLADTLALLQAQLSVREKLAEVTLKENDALDPKGAAIDEMSKALEETRGRYDALMQSAETWSGFVANQFAGLVTGAMSVKDAFQNMVTSVIAWLGQLLAKMIAVAIVQSIIGAVTGGAGSTFLGSSFGLKVPTGLGGSSVAVPSGVTPSMSSAPSGFGGGTLRISLEGAPRVMSPREAALQRESIEWFAAAANQHLALGGSF